jgi:imidazoleglycerol phosphate synthase glutamine amidotransferase subunit HisH
MSFHHETLYKYLCGGGDNELDVIKLSCNIDHISWDNVSVKTGKIYKAKLWREGKCRYVVSYYINNWGVGSVFQIRISNLETKASYKKQYGSAFFIEPDYEKFREHFKLVTNLDPYLFQ